MTKSISQYKQPRALVVDDSATVQQLMDLMLRPLGVNIEFASRGDDAIAMALDQPYDIIFLDIMLPGVDGYQVCKAIKRDPRAMSVMVIMLTSKGSTFDKIKGVMAGTNAYLTKPLDRAKLIAAIDTYVPGLRSAGEWWLKTQAVNPRTRDTHKNYLSENGLQNDQAPPAGNDELDTEGTSSAKPSRLTQASSTQ